MHPNAYCCLLCMALLAKNAPPCKSLHGAAALNGRLPPEDGSDRPETSGKRVSGDPRHFIFRRHKHFLRPKFLLQKFFRQRSKTFFSKVGRFWRSCAGLHTNVECSSRIHCQNYRFQPSTTLGGGVKRVKTVFVVSFGLKKLIPSSFFEILFTFVYLLPIRRIRV